MAVTLEDLEVRYGIIRKNNPQAEKCSVRECSNPRDWTPLLGQDTTCAYHRLLFDHWFYEVADLDLFSKKLSTQKGRRRAFTNWRNRIGKEECDQIVLKMAQESINWEC